MAFYIVFFIMSIISSIIFLFVWSKRVDISYVFFMLLIDVSNLGTIARVLSTTVETAYMGNAISYVGACYLQVIITFIILSLCKIKISKYLSIGMILFGTVMYAVIITDPYTHLFYKSVWIEHVDGMTVLYKEYAIMHSVQYVMFIAYFIINLILLFYAFNKKKNASTFSIFILFLIEFTSLFVYFAQKFFPINYELSFASYSVSQVALLFMINRFTQYDVESTVLNAMLNANILGSFSFALNGNYLGSNSVCEKWMPELKALRVDEEIPADDKTTLFVKIREWIKLIEESGRQQDFYYSRQEAIYRVTGGFIIERNKKRGYQFSVRDFTKEQKYMDLLNNYNSELEKKVSEKTENIREMHERMVLGMAEMVQSRDNSTGHHIKRTSQGVRIIISKILENNTLGVDEEFCRAVIKAAPMHDLGKIAVDDAILKKPARFTDEEFEKMKAHTTEGALIVKKLLTDMQDDYFANIAENVAHYHHERMDGTGYPCGLKGEEIPLEARIMAIADVYDALVSKRCYKESMSFDQSFDIVLKGMGPQFDVKLLPFFMAARPELEAFYTQEFNLS